jgi:hypothetical protein
MAWHVSQGPAQAFEGDKPFGVVLGYPPDLLDSYFEDLVEGEPNIVALKAGGPAFVECARTHPNPLPGPGAAAVDSDAYTKASVLLQGEQNIKLPFVGCEQYAAPCAPQPISFLPSPLLLPSLDTHARSIAPGECIASVQRADPHLEVLKPSDWNDPPLEEPGGVFLGPVHMAEKAGAEASERAQVDAHKPGGASLDANPAPAPTEGTASVELAGGVVKATIAQPEALDLWAKSEAWRRLGMPPLLLP